MIGKYITYDLGYDLWPTPPGLSHTQQVHGILNPLPPAVKGLDCGTKTFKIGRLPDTNRPNS